MINNRTFNKCNFCRYFVGNECSVQRPDGTVAYYYCKDANNEYYAWLKDKKKRK